MTIQTIALNLLVPSTANVRRTDPKGGIAELAASIHAHGLRQNLNVSALENGHFAVEAGERRRKALKLLVKQGKLAKDAPIDCLVLDAADNASEISLVENSLRLTMHPDDQCEAFRTLIERDQMTVENVAARFGISTTIVKQRLKLANVAPDLRALYRKGELNLEQMMAFAISDDHIAQVQAWEGLQAWNRHPSSIKEHLTQDTLPVSHKLVLVAGLESYLAAGGQVLRDLFDEESQGYATDRGLVMRLVDAKMEEAMAGLRAEGWKWVIAEIQRDYSTPYRRVYPQPIEGEDAPAYLPDDLARAGARVIAEHDGELRIERGLVHRDDWQVNAEEEIGQRRRPEKATGMPASLVEDLTAQRTAALRIEVVRTPALALTATVHAMALSQVYPGYSTCSCLAIRSSSERLVGHTTAPGDCAAHAALEAEAEMWGDRLPGDPADLWDWCVGQPQDVLLDLLAFLSALTINAVQTKHDRPGYGRLRHADQLAASLGLRMEHWWKPSVDGFFGRLSKAMLADAVKEAAVPTGVSISGLKKAEAAKFVARLLAGTSWLPAPLALSTQGDAAPPLAEAA